MFENKLILVFLALLGVLIYLAYRIFRNPFKYPYFTYVFNVTGKRNVQVEDYIDNFIRDKQTWNLLKNHQQMILEWKRQTESDIQKGWLCRYRMWQYQKTLDDSHAYRFLLNRTQTRYRQQNYVKIPYKVNVTESVWPVNWQWLDNRYNLLKKIGFEATLREYNSQSQRKLMTPALRKRIMERDHYTCQNCGKYMPDEVGLHIDHIIPIAKGGKSVPSNLCVLCSKCNGSKGAK